MSRLYHGSKRFGLSNSRLTRDEGIGNAARALRRRPRSRTGRSKKGIAIIAPLIRRKAETESLESNEEQSVVCGFKITHVFSEQQTDGEPLPQIASVTGDPGYFLSRLEEFVRGNGIDLRYSDEIAPARGMAEKGKITLLPEQTPAETFATLVHEVAHSELHFGDLRSETTKRIRETEAESVAYVVCSAIGLETGTAARDYVGLYGGDSKLLLESLQYIQRAASRVLTAITAESSAISEWNL